MDRWLKASSSAARSATVVLVFGAVGGAALAQPGPSPSTSSQAAGQPSPAQDHLQCPPFPGTDQFVAAIDNPYFPLAPGTVFTYRLVRDQQLLQDVVEVTSATKTILGVSTTVVHDVASTPDGTPVEDTLDWYAQDRAGNVWYFGEDTKELQNGQLVSTEGSWQAGVKGAQAGFIMEGQPRVGSTYRQECADQVAADTATVLDLETSVTVPDGAFDHVQVTKEFTPIEPNAIDHKYYAPCVGLIRELAIKGGQEESNLVNVAPPSHGSALACGPTAPLSGPTQGSDGATPATR